MIRPVALSVTFLIALCSIANLAKAEQSATPILALWEFDGWSKPTAERPLGLRFLLLEDGRAVFSFDEPALDALIPVTYFQAVLPEDEVKALNAGIAGILGREAAAAQLASREGSWTAFYFRDPASGAPRRAEVAGHPCLARGRVFSPAAPVEGMQSERNSEDREALTPALRQVCNMLAGFHHAGAQNWDPTQLPAPVPTP